MIFTPSPFLSMMEIMALDLGLFKITIATEPLWDHLAIITGQIFPLLVWDLRLAVVVRREEISSELYYILL